MRRPLWIGGSTGARYLTGYAALIAATGLAVVLLVNASLEFGLDTWLDTWLDPNDFELKRAWRAAAVLADTSGAPIGLGCALVAELLVAHATRFEAWRTRLVTALFAGVGLAVVDLALAFWKATPRLRELAVTLSDSNHQVVVNPGSQHHVPVVAGLALVAAAMLMAAVLGLGLSHMGPFSRYVLAAL